MVHAKQQGICSHRMDVFSTLLWNWFMGLGGRRTGLDGRKAEDAGINLRMLEGTMIIVLDKCKR